MISINSSLFLARPWLIFGASTPIHSITTKGTRAGPSYLVKVRYVSSSPWLYSYLLLYSITAVTPWPGLSLGFSTSLDSILIATIALGHADYEIWMMSPRPPNIRFPWLLGCCTVVRHRLCSPCARDEHVQVAHWQNPDLTFQIMIYGWCLIIPPTFVSPDCLIFVLLSGIIHDHSMREMNMFKSRTYAMPEMWCNLSNEWLLTY